MRRSRASSGDARSCASRQRGCLTPFLSLAADDGGVLYKQGSIRRRLLLRPVDHQVPVVRGAVAFAGASGRRRLSAGSHRHCTRAAPPPRSITGIVFAFIEVIYCVPIAYLISLPTLALISAAQQQGNASALTLATSAGFGNALATVSFIAVFFILGAVWGALNIIFAAVQLCYVSPLMAQGYSISVAHARADSSSSVTVVMADGSGSVVSSNPLTQAMGGYGSPPSGGSSSANPFSSAQ